MTFENIQTPLTKTNTTSTKRFFSDQRIKKNKMKTCPKEEKKHDPIFTLLPN